MQAHDHSAHGTPAAGSARISRRAKWVFGGFAAIAALLLALEHRAHLTGFAEWLPWLIVLACPLMHLFMHGDHGHGGHDHKSEGERK